MSVPPKGEELRSMQKCQALVRKFTHTIADALKEEIARGASIKTIMAWTGAGERAVKGCLSGSYAPRAFQLECLLRSSEVVYEQVMIRSGRLPVVNRKRLETLKAQINELIGEIDAALS